MEARLIILPNPVLVSDEEIEKGDRFYHYSHGKFGVYMCEGVVGKSLVIQNKQSSCWSDYSKKIIAGIEDLPTLDLSLIAEGIGWVDVDKLAIEELGSGYHNYDLVKTAWTSGFKANQSLNEKKFTLADIQEAWDSGKHYGQTECEFYNTDSVSRTEYERCESKEQFIQSLSKPKEYQVSAFFDEKTNSYKVTKIVKSL